MHGWAAMLTGTLSAHISAHTSITASIKEKLKCSRCLCFSCRNGFSLFFSFSSSCTLSLLKRLRPTGISGSKDTSCFDFSVANYSALTWAAFFFKASRSVFLAPLKEGGLAIEGKEQQTFGFRKPLSSHEAPTYVKRGIVHNGWYAHLFQFNAGTGTEAHAGHKAANTHKYFHKEKSQMAGLNSSAQFRRTRSECTS